MKSLKWMQTPAAGVPLVFASAVLCTAVVNAEQMPTDPVETITIIGKAADAMHTPITSGALGNMAVLDTPFSVSTVSAEEIEQRQVNSLDSLFARDASVSANGGTYSGWGSTISVRGLPLDYTNSFKINGLAIDNFSGELPYEAFEQVSLLKGATGFMYGFAAPGGVVNYRTKQPIDNYLSMDVGYRSDAIYRGHLDASTLFGDADQYGIRVNVAHEEGDIYDDGELNRDMASLAFTAQLTDTLQWTFDAIYNNRKTRGSSSWLTIDSGYDRDSSLPAAPDGDTNLAFNGAFNKQRNEIIQTALNWQFAEHWQAQLEYGYSRNDTRWLKSWPYLLNSQGDLNFRYYDQYFDVDFDQVQAAITGDVNTWGLAHHIHTGVTWQKSRTYRNDPNRDVAFMDGIYNLHRHLRPTHNTQLPETLSAMWNTTQKAFFLNDNIAFNDHWMLIIGGRANRYEYQVDADIYQARLNDYEDTEVSPMAALLYKPNADTTLYTSYVESFEEGSMVGEEYANANEMLPPLESKQYEVGIKFQRDRWAATTDVFRIERGAEVTNGANELVQDGITLYQGWEGSLQYHVTPTLLVSGDAMLLDASYDKTSSGSTIKNNDAAGAPDKQMSLQVTYDVPAVAGLQLNAGMKYYGETAVNAANDWHVPGYTLFDMAASYRTLIGDNQLTLRAAVTNLGDKAYWAVADSSGWLRIGEPRVISLSAKLDF